MSGTPGDFPATFWQHVEQQLRNLCTAHARCLVAEVEGWSEAYDSIFHHAHQRGALYLPPDTLMALEDWIAQCLLDEIERAEAEGWQHWPEVHHA